MTAASRGVSERAAVAAIEQARRMLCLPTIRDQFTATAQREQLSYLGFLAEQVIAEYDDRRRAAAQVSDAGFPSRTARRVLLRRQPGDQTLRNHAARHLRLG